jgi:hypothetical protein
MRSHWHADACYLLMDAGPYGTSHGHEDCLSLSVSSYGLRQLIDCGPYNYEDTNPFRIYCMRSHGKTMPIIDDLSQNRFAALVGKNNVDIRVGEPAPPPPHVWDHATPVIWRTSPKFDYAAGSYGAHKDEVWGAQKVRPAITTRHVFYLKPDVWVVIDAFKALDEAAHTYSGLFQCSAEEVKVDHATQRVTVQVLPGQFEPTNRVKVTRAQPSLTITPLAQKGLKLSVVKGQTQPTVSGWQFEKNTPWLKHPIPTARYDLPPAKGDAFMAYVLAAAPGTAAPRTPTITSIASDKGSYALDIKFTDGKAYTVVIALDGKVLSWKGKVYQTPALVVSADGVHDWSKVG